MILLGEYWLRAKLNKYSAKTFHRADSRLTYAAIQDVLRELDRCRGA